MTHVIEEIKDFVVRLGLVSYRVLGLDLAGFEWAGGQLLDQFPQVWDLKERRGPLVPAPWRTSSPKDPFTTP